MLIFDVLYKLKLENVGLEPVLHSRYVDDNNMAGEEIPDGIGIVNKENGSIELGEVDKIGESGTKRTARIYRELANTIMPASIEMEEDIGENHPTNKLPMLDIQVWMEEDSRIRYSFFSKPMATEELTWERSVLPQKQK